MEISYVLFIVSTLLSACVFFLCLAIINVTKRLNDLEDKL